jgi:hypothetical protein
MKVACTVREEAVGKGPQTSGTSLAAYFIEEEQEEVKGHQDPRRLKFG